QRRELEERAALVDEQLDALAREQLAAGAVPRHALLATTGDRLRMLGVELDQLREHRLAVAHDVTHPSTTVRIRSSVVRMPRSLVRPRSRPSSSQYARIGRLGSSRKYSVTTVPS